MSTPSELWIQYAHLAEGGFGRVMWEADFMELMKRLEAEHARELAVRIPQGWKLVPIEPTEAMLEALGNTPWIVECETKVIENEVITNKREYRDQRYFIDGWAAMLAAAPEANLEEDQ